MRRTTLPAVSIASLLGLTTACGDGAQAAEGAAPRAFSFVDVAAEAGAALVNVSGDPRRWYIPESNGNGAAWIDHDGDGDMDLFVGNGQGVRYEDDGRRLVVEQVARCALYRNDSPAGGPLRFADVSAETGTARTEWVQGIATGDVDNDGDTDLFLANLGPDVLLRNEGGRFVDATAESGLGSPLWGASAAFGDADNDGDLDLYVANYCEWDFANPPAGGARNAYQGVEVAWGPIGENKQHNPGAPDLFYLNDGQGRFRDATAERGFALQQALCSYAVVFCDVDSDGWQDVLVANDLEPTNLFLNQGDGRFEEQGVERGFAFDSAGKPTSAMGLMVADVDGDGDQDVYRSNFDLEANSLHLNDGRGQFREVAAAWGLAEPSTDRLGWGGGFLDAECDGDLDLFVANGHVYPQAQEIGMSGWLMASQLYEAVAHKDGTLRYVDATARAGEDVGRLRSARGVAIADADSDGDLDLCVVDIGEPLRLLENRTPRMGHWISVHARGRVSNRDGYGAVVRVTAGGRTRVREVRATDGLYSSNDPRAHFGLGPVDEIERVEVRWPSGMQSVVEAPPLDAVLEVVEPEEIDR
jgi:hypothetical protein